MALASILQHTSLLPSILHQKRHGTYGRPRSLLEQPRDARGSPWKRCWLLCLDSRISPSVPDTLYIFSVNFLSSGKCARRRNVPRVLNKEKLCPPAPKRCESGPDQGVP